MLHQLKLKIYDVLVDVAVLGIGLFALPAGILASGFTEELRKDKDRKQHDSPDQRVS